MAGDDLPGPRPDFFARLSALETIVAAVFALAVLAGLMLVGKGFYMKTRNDGSQVQRSYHVAPHVAGNPLPATRAKESPSPFTTGSVPR